MSKVAPYLHINGKTREAFEFYQDALGGELEIKTAKGTPMADMMPDAPADFVMHAVLKKGDLEIMGSDMYDPSSFTPGDTVSVCVSCDTKEELVAYFDKIAVGGDVFQEPKEEFFGWFASVTDKYGIDWMFQAESKTV